MAILYYVEKTCQQRISYIYLIDMWYYNIRSLKELYRIEISYSEDFGYR
jgi:hypothetical protein